MLGFLQILIVLSTLSFMAKKKHFIVDMQNRGKKSCFTFGEVLNMFSPSDQLH